MAQRRALIHAVLGGVAAIALALGGATAAGAVEDDPPTGAVADVLAAAADETADPLEGIADDVDVDTAPAPAVVEDAPASASAPALIPTPAVIPPPPPVPQGTGTISGTVTREDDGAPISGVSVSLTGSGWVTPSALTDANGDYTVSGLADDSYVVSFFAGGGTDLMREYWQGVTDFSAATPVAITGGASVTDIDASLRAGGAIEGVVTRAQDGSPVAGADVSALNANNEIVASTQADTAGEYRLGGLPAGAYRVRFGSPDPELVSEYWSNAYSWDTATPVTITGAQAIMNVDAALDSVGYISGTVTKSADGTPAFGSVMVSGVDRDMRVVSINGDGSYRAAVAPGTYVVHFDAFDSGLLDEYWEDAATEEAATPVVVESGDDITGTDAQLDSAATITGTVTMVSSEGREMLVEAWDGDERVGYVIADWQTGSYTLNIPAGTYIFKASVIFYNDSPTTAKPQFYDGVETADLATPVTAAASTTVGGIDFTLVPITKPEPEPEAEPEPALALATGSIRAGSDIDISGTGFAPGAKIAFELRSAPQALGTLTAGASGALTGTFRVPASTSPGTHTLVALNAQSEVVASARLLVTAAPGASVTGAVTGAGAPLASTGADAPAFAVMMASGLLLAGMLLVRRRRAQN